jgi:hypothetical protein
VKRAHLLLVFGVAVGLYLPALRYTFVQDDRAIIALNPNVHSLGAALTGFDDPYWPRPSRAGLYRPLATVTFAVDWAISGARPWWFHLTSALWHGLACVLVAVILSRWLPAVGAVAAGLVFAAHPVHVEAVASLVARAEIMAAVGILTAVWCARRAWFAGAVVAAAMAMFSKEHGVIVGVVILADDWLNAGSRPRYPKPFYWTLAALTVGYLVVWWLVGRAGFVDMAPLFKEMGTGGRLANAFPAILRAATLLIWPVDLSADYGPQVLPVRTGLSLAALGGFVVVTGVIGLAVWSWRRRHAGLAFAAIVSMIAYLPTSNLLFASGIVLAERNLYLPVFLVATAVGTGAAWVASRRGVERASVLVGLVVIALALRTELRLPAWESNRRFLLTTLAEHPEAYRAHVWAAAVLSGIGDTVGARREYARAESLFARDPHLDGAHAYYLMTLGDTAAAAPRIERARQALPNEPFALRAHFLWLLARGDTAGARALADSANAWFDLDAAFYRERLARPPRP